jgi:hypothetical protein
LTSSTEKTTTTTTTVGERDGVKLVVSSQSNTVTVGNFVTDVSVQPFIASRVVAFNAYNLRPNHVVHVFFDSVNVDRYCRPGVVPSGRVADTSNPNSITPNGNLGDPIYTNSSGKAAGWFVIPANTFRTGEHLFQISDVDDLVRGNTAYTTIASAEFTASNLTVTKRTETLTTINPKISYQSVSDRFVDVEVDTVTTSIPDVVNVNAWYEPVAQAFQVTTPNKEAGIFATSIELYFKQKPQANTNGVTLYVCETDNGYPNGSRILPYTTVHLDWDDVNVSNTASTSTKFSFDSPVFLNNGGLYAFIIKPDANDPDYHIWTANLGDRDVTSGVQVFSQPIIGTAFYGATMNQWTALQTEYVKFALNRAAFSPRTAYATFYNTNTDFISIHDVAYSNTSVVMSPGDYVYSSTNSSVATLNSSSSGVLNHYDSSAGVIYVDVSSGVFSGNSFVQIHRLANSSVTPSANTLIAYGNTGSLYNPIVNAVVPKLSMITPAGTTATVGVRCTSNAYALDTSWLTVTPGIETELLDKERVVVSRSNEVAHMANNKSFTLRVTMKSDSSYVSPVIDGVRNQQLIVSNLIDPVAFDYREFFTNGGAKSKYVSKVVTLADGQDAEDLQVTISAYRPPKTDIKVFARFLNGEDHDSISSKTWAPLINRNAGFYSDPANPEAVNEFTYTVGGGYSVIPTNGMFTSSNGSTTVTGNGTLFMSDVEPGWYVNTRSSTQALLNNTPYSITANTAGFVAANDVIKLTSASTLLPVNTRVMYSVPTNNTAIAGLTGNSYYYVAFANSTAFSLSTTLGGANINITDTRTTDPGETHYIYKEAARAHNEVTRRIVSVANDTSLTIDEPFIGNYTNQPLYLVAPPTTPYQSTAGSRPITGTVTVSTTNNSIVGVGTSFNVEVSPGDVVKVNGDSQAVVSVANATYMTVGTTWTTDATNVAAAVIEPLGLTYLDDTSAVFTGFKKFQIKIALQSNVTQVVPVIDDLQCLALQL